MLRTIGAAVGRFRNVLVVALAVAAGVAYPGAGASLEPLVGPLVAFLVYSSLRGWRADGSGEVTVASYGALVALAVGLSYVVVPAGGIRLARAAVGESAVLGFAVALSAPTTAGSAVLWTRFADGDVRLSATAAVASLALAPAATPAVLAWLAGASASVPTAAVAVDLATIVGGGALLVAALPSAVPSRAVNGGATLAIALLIYASVAGIDPAGISLRVLPGIVAVAVGLVGLGLAAATLCGRALGLDGERILPLFFAGSLKNLGVALLLAVPYADPLIVTTVITSYVVQQLSAALIADARAG